MPTGLKEDVAVPTLIVEHDSYETEVDLNGTPNGGRDADAGWSVEGRLAWMSFLHTEGYPRIDETWRFALCRYDYPADNGNPELSTCKPLSEVNFHRPCAAGPRPIACNRKLARP